MKATLSNADADADAGTDVSYKLTDARATSGVSFLDELPAQAETAAVAAGSKKFTPFSRFQWKVIGCMYAGYAGILLNRADVALLLPAMVDSGDLTVTSASQLIAVGTFAYLVGKLSVGFLVDRLGGRYSFLICLLFTAIFSTLFTIPVADKGSAAMFVWLISCWAFNRYVQSSGWPSMAQLIRGSMAPSQHGRSWGFISTASRLGSVAATVVVSVLLLHGISWRSVVLICVAVLAVFFCVNVTFLRGGWMQGNSNNTNAEEMSLANDEATSAGAGAGASRDEGDTAAFLPSAPSPATAAAAASTSQRPPAARAPVPVLVLLQRFWVDPRFTWICLSVALLDVVLDFESFIALFLQSWFELTPGMAALATGVFPLGATISVVVGGFLIDRLDGSIHRSRRLMDWCLGLMALCLSLLMLLYVVSSPSASVMGLALVLLFAMGLFLGFPCYLPMNLYGISFGQEECGVLVSLIDSCGYAACVIFEFAVGALAADGSWTFVLAILLVCSTLGVAVTHVYFVQEERLHRRH